MAYSKAPTQDTYSSEKISLAREINTRPGYVVTKDEDYLNCFLDPVRAKVIEDKRTFITSRPGSSVLKSNVGTGGVRGIYVWEEEQKCYYCVNDDLYVVDLTTLTTTTLSNQFATTTGVVGFTQFLYDDNSVVVIATDGDTLLQIDDTNTVTVCADADLPSPHLPYPVFLDGYLFLALADSGDIYNSNLNDPLAWLPGDFISCEMEGDKVVQIAKLNNYILAFGGKTIEYFWDAANETASPLQRNDTPVKLNSLIGGVAPLGDKIYFVGSNVGGQPEVFVLEGLKMSTVSNPVVSRYLERYNSDYASLHAAIISIYGKSFYMINIGSYTWVLDVEEKLWCRWAYKNGTNFRINHCVNTRFNTGYYPIFTLTDSGALYQFDDQVTTDSDVPFTIQFVTEPSDFGTMNRKTMSRLSVICDRPAATTNVLIQWSDDDYKTYNTGLTINLDQDLPSCYRLGSFRQRSFKFSYTGDSKIRVQSFEVDINKGTS